MNLEEMKKPYNKININKNFKKLEKIEKLGRMTEFI